MELKVDSELKKFNALCFLEGGSLLLAKGNELFIFNIKTQTKSHLVSLPYPIHKKILSKFRLVFRLLRMGVRYAIPIDKNVILAAFDNVFYEININSGSFKKTFNILRGNRPLNISEVKDIVGFDPTFYFGEYFMNFEKAPVHIYKRLVTGEWSIAHTFPAGSIEHVHAIVPDKYRNCVWVFTGDFDDAAAIWMAKDNFNEVIPILIGDQKYRACVGFPEEKGLVYATDSQFEINSVRLLTEINDKWESKFIFEVNGPVIYGCKVKDKLFFSTSVEGDSVAKGTILKYLDRQLGPGIKENYSHIVSGNLKEGFEVVNRNQKDIYPFLLFQFGVLTFPMGENLSNQLYAYNVSLVNNDLGTTVFNIN